MSTNRHRQRLARPQRWKRLSLPPAGVSTRRCPFDHGGVGSRTRASTRGGLPSVTPRTCCSPLAFLLLFILTFRFFSVPV
jgi:hypothetical protein